MKQLNKEIFVCIDCEATGLEPKTDRLIEVAVAAFTLEKTLVTFEALVNPEMAIPEESIKIHHITDDMVKDKPKVGEVLGEVLKIIGRKIIVGHSIQYDIDLIQESAKRSAVPCTISNNRVIDTLRLARYYGESPSNSLETLRKHFNIEYEGPHRAMSDVIVNIEVFKHLTKRFKNLNQIFSVLSKPIKMDTMPLGQHKGRPLKEVPLDYLIWASKRDFDQDLIFSLKDEIKRRRQGNVFGQANNPFLNL